jgi:hypothetical protein
MLWRVARICRAALDLLTVPGDLEERAGIPLLDDTYDTGSDRSLQSCVASLTELSDVPTNVSSSVSICTWAAGASQSSFGTRRTISMSTRRASACHTSGGTNDWCSASGGLYKQDLKIENLKKQ